MLSRSYIDRYARVETALLFLPSAGVIMPLALFILIPPLSLSLSCSLAHIRVYQYEKQKFVNERDLRDLRRCKTPEEERQVSIEQTRRRRAYGADQLAAQTPEQMVREEAALTHLAATLSRLGIDATSTLRTGFAMKAEQRYASGQIDAEDEDVRDLVSLFYIPLHFLQILTIGLAPP